ncbi:MAG: hypothetical protein IBJ03_11235 [Gemmatimonadaceae bacterium]|nr:hypothetical protein [Gemmatimonadaceae bacterium]
MRLLLALTFTVLLGCSEEAAEKAIESALVRAGGAAELVAPPGTTLLPASELFAASPAFGIPYRVRAIRGDLLVADQARGPRIHLVDGETGALLRSLGRSGRGPGEFESVVSIDTLAGVNGVVSLYDYNQQRITTVSTDSLQSRGIHVVETTRLDWRPESVARLLDGRLVATNASDSSVLQIIDSSGRRIEHLALPALRVPLADSHFLRTAYKARICGVRNNHIALALRYTPRMAIVDVASKRDIAASVPHSFSSSFIDTPLIGRRMFKGGAPGVRYAYIDCVATDDAIYALFSGRLIGKYDRATNNAGRYVHRFDWSGRHTASWQLDHDAYAFAVLNSFLITIAEGEVPTLRRTRMPVDQE